MLEKFLFENHRGQRFDGLENGVYLNYNELRDYTWEYDLVNSRISRFYRGPRQRKLPLLICCATVSQAAEVKNRLLDLAEMDIEALKPGKIHLGGYYTTGYITASTKTNYLITGRYCAIELLLTSTEPYWSREDTFVFGGSEDTVIIKTGIDYAYDYAFDYSVSHTSRELVCNDVRKSHFRMRIYGAVTDPQIRINGHVYQVFGTIKEGEMLEIDSRNRTIILTAATGEKVNWFANRSRESYIFEPIPTGTNSVYYNGTFTFDLTVIEERSEPRWT